MKVDAVCVDEDKCVALRNRNSKCRKCAEACIADAITIKRNKVEVDSSRCVGCASCVGACPISAFTAQTPTSEQVITRMQEVACPQSRTVVVTCARKAATQEGDPDCFAEVPCLAHITEAQLLDIITTGFDDIVLVDGGCESCKLGTVSPAIDEAVENCAAFLDASSAPAIVTRTSEFPPEVSVKDPTSLRGKSRRGLARQTGSLMRQIASNAAKHTLESQLNLAESESSKRRRKIQQNGRLPEIIPATNYSIIDNMLRLAENNNANGEVKGALDTRHFGDVCIDEKSCSGCGMCVLFCPTGALKYNDYDKPDDSEMRYVDFRASDCTQCKLCQDVCLRNAIKVSQKVDSKQVCDIEPKMLEMPTPRPYSFFASNI